MGGYQNDPGTAQQEAGFGYFGNFLTESLTDNITAAASGTRAAATKLTTMVNRVTTAAVNASVKLPQSNSSLVGVAVCIINATANPIQVFADGTDAINGVAAATGVNQMQNSVVYYLCTGVGTWVAQGLGSGFSGQYATYSVSDNQQAFATGGQANGTPIIASIARFTTVTSAGDSAKLPQSAPGMAITVVNATGTSMNVFPFLGDTINALSVNAAFALAGGKTVDLYATSAGQWHGVLSA